MNLSFSGCGFLGIYHVGVAVCFKKYAPHILLEKIGGASAGALAACCLLCDLPLGNMTSEFLRVVNGARRHSLGPFSPSFNIQTCLYEGLEKHLPEDVHKRVNGRLHVSLTRVYDGKNVIVSQFDSREDVLQALLCACWIPGFSGILPPRFRGVRYMDGAFSNNLPILDENTITVSPFCGESDICPRDQSSQLFHVNWANTSIEISRANINRFVRIIFPPRPEFLSNLCQQGFDDALKFLHRNKLISCRRCIAVQSTFVLSESLNDSPSYDPECRECKKHRKDALIGEIPDTVINVIQGYIDQANKGLANWLFKHRGIKLLSLPATVPAEFLLATINKLSYLALHIAKQFKQFIVLLLEEVNDVVLIKLLNKISINLDLQNFDCIAGLLQQSSKLYGSRVSLMIDDNGPNYGEEDTYDNILKVTTHQDAVYAYYYTDGSNKVKVTEIFDMTENNSLPPELNLFDGSSMENHHTIDIENEWNGIESDLLIGTTLNDIYDSSLFETNNNFPDDHHKLDFDGIEIEEIGSDYSDPEVDHYVSEQAKNTILNGQQQQQLVQHQQQQPPQQQHQQITLQIEN